MVLHQQGTLTHLRMRLESLTEMERQTVSGILQEPARVLGESIHELAQRVGVSEATVIRACKSLGYKGYPELKMALAVDLATTASEVQPSRFIGQVEVGDSIETVVKKVMQANIDFMHQTLRQFDFRKFEEAVEAILSAKSVAVLAGGTLSHVVDLFCSKLVFAGIKSIGRTDHLQQLQLAAVAEPGDVLLFFSHSGRIRALVQAAELARARGATTIVVTSFSQSPLAKAVDICVTTYFGDVDIYLQAMGSQVPRLVLIDCLLVALAARKGESSVENFRLARNAIKDFQV